MVSIFPDYVTMEMFKTKGKKRILVGKNYEKFSIPLLGITKVDVMDLENMTTNFIKRCGITRGKVILVLFGSKDVMDYREIELSSTKKREVEKILPLEIEDLEIYSDFLYKYEIYGNQARVLFMKKDVVEHLSSMKFPGDWELACLVPGYVVYQPLVQKDGFILELRKDTYVIYAYKNGFIKGTEKGSIYKDFSIDRPLDPSPNELFEQIEFDVRQYVSNFSFTESIDTDLVRVDCTDNFSEEFEPKEVEGIYFEKVRDLREWLDISEEDGYDQDEYVKRFEYSGVSVGVFYLKKDIAKYDFSPEKLGIMYKNLLVTTVSFSLMLAVSLPSLSILMDKQIQAYQMDVDSYKRSIAKYEESVKGLRSEIDENDKIIKDYNDYVSSLEKLSNVDRNFISSVLGYLPNNTPSTILVQEVRLTKGSKSLVLKGLSQTYRDIGAFAIQLEKFGKVNIKKIDNNKLFNQEGYPFEIELQSY